MKTLLIVFSGAVAFMFLCAFFPTERLWGFFWWANFLLTMRIVIVTLVLALGAVATWMVYKRHNEVNVDISKRAYTWLFYGLPSFMVAAFVLLRARTFFMGDGYTLISLMAAGHPVIKSRNYGGTLAPYAVSHLFGTRTEASVTAAYQIVSILAGLLFIAVLLYAATRLFDKRVDRVIFAAGVLVGGYSLQFFGYVENYSLFLVAVLSFALCGVLVARKELGVWTLFLTAGVASFVHIFGAILILPIGYLLLARTRIAKRVSRASRLVKISLSFAVLLLGVAAVSIVAWQSLAVRFAILPPVATFYSYKDYTLFSPNHLIDCLNLLFVLIPAAVVMLPLWWGKMGAAFRQRPDTHFLLACTAVSFALLFILDPKPGMPRDWDLFSFAAIPFTVLIWLGWLRVRDDSRSAMVGATLAILLGFVVLMTRAVVLAIPQSGVNVASLYMELDQQKGRTGVFTLRQYYFKKGETALAAELDILRAQAFPEEGWLVQAAQLAESGRWDHAKAYLDRARQKNSALSNVWLAYGSYYLDQNRFDSAEYYLKVSDAMVPYNGSLYSEMGRLRYYQRRFEEAEELLLRAVELDTVADSPVYGLARLAAEKGDRAKYIEYLARAVMLNPSRSWMNKELGDAYKSFGDREQARRAYELALRVGLDSATYRSLIEGL